MEKWFVLQPSPHFAGEETRIEKRDTLLERPHSSPCGSQNSNPQSPSLKMRPLFKIRPLPRLLFPLSCSQSRPPPPPDPVPVLWQSPFPQHWTSKPRPQRASVLGVSPLPLLSPVSGNTPPPTRTPQVWRDSSVPSQQDTT